MLRQVHVDGVRKRARTSIDSVLQGDNATRHNQHRLRDDQERDGYLPALATCVQCLGSIWRT